MRRAVAPLCVGCGGTHAALRGYARPREAKRYLEKYKRLDVAIDAYYTNPNGLPAERSSASVTKIGQLFDQYKGAPPIGPALPPRC